MNEIERRQGLPDLSARAEVIMNVLALHCGGWIGNGGKDSHCICGYRPVLGEFHGRHVALDIDAALSS